MNETNKKTYVFFLCLYLLALPLGAMSIGVIGSALRIVALLPVITSLFGSRRLYFSATIKKYFWYIVVCGISILYSRDMSAAWNKFSSMFLLFLLLASTTCYELENSDLAKLKKALIWSSRISLIMCLAFNTYVEGRMYFQNDFFSEDPNGFCAYLSFGLIYAIERLINEKGIMRKTVSLLEAAAYLTVALLTGSRGGVIALCLGILIYILFSTRNIIGVKSIVVIAVIVGALYAGSTYLSEETLTRFTIQDVTATGGTGRILIWTRAFSVFKQSDLLRKLFGQGIGCTIAAWGHYGIYDIHVCHNMFIESLIEIGVVGLLAYTSMIFSFLKVAFRRTQKYAFGVFAVMVLLSLSLSIATFKPYINIMIYILFLEKCTDERNMSSFE